MTRLGGLAWLSAAQFFAAQAVVASAWRVPFSLAERNISDLGNTVCGAYPATSANMVCSPWHAAMNASFLTIGVTMAAGAVLSARAFAAGRAQVSAIVLFGLAGAGVILVGLYPENEAPALHAAGAGLNLVAGNVALVLFGLALPGRQPLLRSFGIAAGLTGLAGTLLFVVVNDAAVGSGTLERLAVYPMPIWQMVMGAAILRHRLTAA
jgi:hypothetical membrane protein